MNRPALGREVQNPLVFLVLMFACQGAYLLGGPSWWAWALAGQLALSGLALFLRSWRFFGLAALLLLGASNGRWLMGTGLTPQACVQNRWTLEGYSKHPSDPGQLDLIRVSAFCGPVRIELAGVRVDFGAPKKPKLWFQSGDRLQLEGLSFQEALGPTPLFAAAPDLKLRNLSQLAKKSARGPLLLYLQAKGRYYLTPTALPFFKALATADRSELSREDKRRFKELGIAHLLAISGMHTGILFLWINLGLRLLLSFPWAPVEKGRMLPWLDGLTLGLLLGFLWMIDLPVSAERAWIMLFWWVSIKHLYHHQPLWLILAGTAQWILLLEPWAMGQVSFQLSFLSVFGILLVLPFLPNPTRRLGWAKAFGVLCLSSLLLSCWLFVFGLVVVDRIVAVHSLFSPVANLLHIGFVSWVVMPVYLLTLLVGLLGFSWGGCIGEGWVFGLSNLVSLAWSELLEFTDWLNRPFLFRLGLDWGWAPRLAVLAALTLLLLWAARWKLSLRRTGAFYPHVPPSGSNG
ncbi:MAG: hypothetical protein A2600_04440 [Candidatus Lambdaproteobacteria bacterium RIFOXYD1_FULL_56_27]|uniref:ComEC/Rec2-related protein domain-containing protein n=1 Tax=Candidatus Lambdaproteobacteria bacterium RIFOXYD2_FULL_56_26 TaxID=1817773 RepID=A0A1F6H3Q1_9PROT|nr:MAG: hypothetical protein A2426_13505 [Candidatus Lambdaproteobacteria bacterium RIFOXYC1_FULL_56_13]OGH05002.1 MAG: hypothetical protein A2557_08505 [Candidatus Lambdaproteobacteria bacterium RIFOXYD2_FULL_56_26]OGH09467.1 MAG: hypothetical protein A2600_04440 [Candidatus Lambdaproteobacteria bacterium RIFOXYD1_FULL_56_27]